MRPVNNCKSFAVYLALCRKLRLPASSGNFLEFCRSGYDLLALDWPAHCPAPGKEGAQCSSAV